MKNIVPVICGPSRVNDGRVDDVLGEPDGEEADRHEHDPEERVHGGDVRAPRPLLDREAEHEVGRVEEEEDEEEHELVLAPEPPVAPRGLGPDGAGGERERAEDRALVDGDVALEVVALLLRQSRSSALYAPQPKQA